VVGNPVDVMCPAGLEGCGLPPARVIGQGGMLDSARCRAFLAMEVGVAPPDIHAFVLGGHTDATMVPVVSQARAGGIPIEILISKERIDAIVKRTMNGGAELVALYKTESAFVA